MNIGIYIYPKVEVLDLGGPFEVFTTAARVNDKALPGLFNVFTIGENRNVVKTQGGLQVLPEYDINEHPPIEVLIIPGGDVSEQLSKDTVISWIKKTCETASLTASVCTGSFLLAKAGLLQNKSATTHWDDIADLKSMFPDINVKENARWVDEGNMVTSAGISAGIDMSLYLISCLINEDLANLTARQMEYKWNKEK